MRKELQVQKKKKKESLITHPPPLNFIPIFCFFFFPFKIITSSFLLKVSQMLSSPLQVKQCSVVGWFQCPIPSTSLLTPHGPLECEAPSTCTPFNIYQLDKTLFGMTFQVNSFSKLPSNFSPFFGLFCNL